MGVSEWEKVVSEVLCHGQYNGHVWCTAMRVGPYKDFPTNFRFQVCISSSILSGITNSKPDIFQEKFICLVFVLFVCYIPLFNSVC